MPNFKITRFTTCEAAQRLPVGMKRQKQMQYKQKQTKMTSKCLKNENIDLLLKCLRWPERFLLHLFGDSCCFYCLQNLASVQSSKDRKTWTCIILGNQYMTICLGLLIIDWHIFKDLVVPGPWLKHMRYTGQGILGTVPMPQQIRTGQLPTMVQQPSLARIMGHQYCVQKCGFLKP